MEENNNVKYVDIQKLMDSDIMYQDLPTPIDTIISRMESGHYLIPEYQRNYVWEEKQVVALIVSLLKDIPIPRLYMYSNPKDGKYTIIDGQQRITSLFFFIKGIFPKYKSKRHYYNFKEISELVEKYKKTESRQLQRKIEKELSDKFELKFKEFNLETENGEKKVFTYDKFSSKQKLEFNNKFLNFGIVSVKNKESKDNNICSVYTDIFRLLNSAGEPLKSQEIRNGIYYGSKLYEEINKFNEENKAWIDIKKNENNRHRNVEFLLRLLALDNYIEIKSKEKLLNYVVNEFKQENFDLNDVKESLTLERYSTYSNLVDRYSKKYSAEKFENKVAKEIEKLKFFVEGISDFPKTENSINWLNLEAFFIASSKLEMIDENFKISYKKLSEELNSKSSTSAKSKIFDRILQAVSIIRKSGEKNEV